MENELRYRAVLVRIGATLILNAVFLLAFSFDAVNFSSILGSFLSSLFSNSAHLDTVCYVFEQIFQIFAYLAAFLIPVIFFKVMSGKEKVEPMRLDIKLTPNAALAIPAAIGCVLGFAYINSIMVSFIDFGPLFESDPLDTPVKALLSFISVALVPACCEEFLFRGCVLSNLLPFGKTVAIIASSLLFALMHGNIAQFFYTFAAGVVLGLVYVETGSIWTSFFIHLFNNFLSVASSVVLDNFGEEAAYSITMMLDIFVICLGLLCAVILIYRKKGKLFALEAEREKQISSNGALKHFFNPVMIAFLVFAGFEALSTVLMLFVIV